MPVTLDNMLAPYKDKVAPCPILTMNLPITEEELEQILNQFDRLSALLVDTSSLILIEKAGFLSLLGKKVKLFSLPQVREEYLRGGSSLPFPEDVQLLPYPEGRSPQLSVGAFPTAASTDEALLTHARTCRLPLLSEDRKLLLKAEACGLSYYNALMMLEFLQYHGAAGPVKKPSAPYPSFNYPNLKERLLAHSRYSREVRRYADLLHTFIEKTGGSSIRH